MKKKVAIIQSNYIPWKGYFDIINDSDLFVFYDDVQFTKNDWRNRNKIKCEGGTMWLSVPVGQELNRNINEVTIKQGVWERKHFKNMEQFYHKAPYFKNYREFFAHVYLERKWENLSELNQFLVKTIATDFLGSKTVYDNSENYKPEGKRLERLLDLIKKCGGEVYISGPSAKNYIDEEEFKKCGVDIEFKDYSSYPEYTQFYPPFEHYVSIIDLLFNTGPDAAYYIWGWREDKK